MVKFLHWHGKGNIELGNNGNFIILIENNDSLQQIIESEILKGVPYFKSFKQAGIPGKIKAFRKIENDKDIEAFLEYMRDDYSEYYIRVQEEQRYTILKWNGVDYDAKFIIRDNATNMQCLLIPGRLDDIFWFNSDLANDPAVSNWEGFGYETTDNLESICF